MQKPSNINTDRLYKMLIHQDKETKILACQLLEGLFPELPQKIKKSIYPDHEIIDWFQELGFNSKKARVVYSVYKIAKFQLQIV